MPGSSGSSVKSTLSAAPMALYHRTLGPDQPTPPGPGHTGTRPLRRRGLLAAMVIAFILAPNAPNKHVYSIGEYICGWFETDEDQWRCDSDPIFYQ